MRDRRADGERVALPGDDPQSALLVGLVHHRGLVGLDLDELLAAAHVLAVALEPAQHGALLHRVGEAGHHDLAHRRLTVLPSALWPAHPRSGQLARHSWWMPLRPAAPAETGTD